VAISAIVPEFVTKSGKMMELYESGSGNYQVTYQQIKIADAEAEVAAYEQALVDAGYTLHQHNTINENQFFTYTNGDTMVHCNYFKSMRQFRIIYGPKMYLGSQEPIPDYEKKVTPSISIVGATDSVLCMVYQAPDGSFVIIDGGYGEDRTYEWTLNGGTSDIMTYTINRDIEKDMASLWALLESKTPAGQKPQVTWMMTHGDPDHICLPPRFMKEYKDKFDLNLVVYNFPIIANVGLKNGEGAATYQHYIDTFINAAKIHFPDAPHMVFHTGQKLYLPGTEIEFLFAAEDYWPNAMPWMNDTCAAWRITSEGKTMLFMGDCTTSLNDQMVRVFGNYLKSDIMQLNHHGSNGGTLSLYKIVQPEVAFWACEDNRFLYDHQRLGTKPGFEFNLYIRETAKYHYSGSYTHTILLPSLQEEK
jgi:glyoxylase-like metal-dependent hydrolase (beta-lactamase superfamily II)